MDGRAEKSLLVQGVSGLVVAGTCDPSKGQVAHPTKQDESKMLKLAHVKSMELARTQNDYVLKSRILGDNVRGRVVDGRWEDSGRGPQVRVMTRWCSVS